MTPLLLALALTLQDQPAPAPQPAAAQEVAPSTQEPSPARTPDPVERPPATTQTPPPAKARPVPAPAAPGRAAQPRPAARPDHCLSRAYTDAHPEACLGPADQPNAGADRAPEKLTPPATVQPNPPAPNPTPPAKTDTPAPPIAEKPALLTRLPVLIALGAGAVLLLLAFVGLILRLRGGGSAAGLREVELAGASGIVLLAPAQLARGARGPGKSRWSVRDGRLILTGPTGALLNGVPLDRTGDIVSTGDTVRLGGAEYRVRII